MSTPPGQFSILRPMEYTKSGFSCQFMIFSINCFLPWAADHSRNILIDLSNSQMVEIFICYCPIFFLQLFNNGLCWYFLSVFCEPQQNRWEASTFWTFQGSGRKVSATIPRHFPKVNALFTTRDSFWMLPCKGFVQYLFAIVKKKIYSDHLHNI